MWHWGTYTTRIQVRNKKVIDLCYLVDESAAANNATPSVAATPEDLATSLNTYQDSSESHLLPTLRTESLKSPAKTAAGILANVDAFTATWFGSTAALDYGAGSGATYSLAGFKGSLQAALIAANL